ncbi:MAG TPA: AbrB/MazE/SpoVT family DNA-binding domain-containing protein [bacterium]|jgi:antitoxin MazE|nr:AbrB/MazE/SpoVT family DNA-binding domain-containing protein [bacterium]HNT66728.1 AbrB/MazE/SpoVT family DNA-binding domain-containing protein [bacterium]HOX85123.1 AbrB/MazE/SpoVT family DNA-binding domain-containing protein [bacterium]HPG47046.1 AbrB/MazE/SpoVT family DNA-binding domain-containing protein [bacterium]HPM99366.1 AbrB/MazE/SpoVT family DNA-binding domain-containing protein [bacterium]
METKIKKWGNSLAVRLPKAFAEQTGIENGSDVQISIQDGKIILIPVKDRAKLLDVLLEKIDESTIQGEVNFGKPVGKELL